MRIKIRNVRISATSTMHYFKLAFRSLLFIAAAIIYIIGKVRGEDYITITENRYPVIMIIIWVVFAVEMALRFFPDKIESMGCQKQFAKNYRPTGTDKAPELPSNMRVFLVFLGWCAFNGIFGVLYLVGILDRGIMLLLSLAFSVCDIICILFFCPFQTWFLKNKCCGTCRIYNWDYAMMFTPLLFVGGIYEWSLLVLALGLFARWEITAAVHPERFAENTNSSLACANCTEKLCQHKRQLVRFHKQLRDKLKAKV